MNYVTILVCSLGCKGSNVMMDGCNYGCHLVKLIKSYSFDICVLYPISIFLHLISYLEAGANSFGHRLGYSAIPMSGTALGRGPTG